MSFVQPSTPNLAQPPVAQAHIPEETIALLRAIAARADTAVAARDLAGRFVLANAAYAAMIACDPDHLLGRTVVEVLSPDEVARIEEEDRRLVAAGRPLVAEVDRIVAGVTQRYLATKYPLLNEQGAVVGVVGIFSEIAPSEAAMAAPALSTEHFWYAFSQAPIGAALFGLDLRCLHVNQALCTMTGYDAAELLQESLLRLSHPDDVATQANAVLQLISGAADAVSQERRSMRSDGSIQWARDQMRLLRGAGGAPLCYLLFSEEITAQKQLVASLERQERTQRAVAACSQRLMGNTADALDEQRALSAALELLRDGVQVLGVDLWENHVHPEQGFSARRMIRAWGPDDPSLQAIGGEQWSVPWSMITQSGMRAIAAGEYVGGPVEHIYGDAPQSLELARDMGVGSVQAFPIRINGQWWGLLVFNAREAREWDEHEVLQVRTAAEIVGAFLQRSRDAAALREREAMLNHANLGLSRRVDELSLLNQIAHLLGGVTDLPETLALVCRLLHETFAAAEVLVALRERPASALRVAARWPDDGAPKRPGTHYPAVAGIELAGTILVEQGADPTHVTLVVALRAQGGVIGLLHLRIEQARRKLTPDTVSLVQTIAGAMASAAATALLYAGAVQSSERLERLNAASRMINGAGLDLPALYRAIHQAIAHLMPVEAFVIALVEESAELVEYAYWYDSRAGSDGTAYAPLAASFASFMRRHGPTLRIDDFQIFYAEHPEVEFQRYGDEEDTRSGLAASFVTADGLYGLLFAQCYPPGAYSDDDLSILELLAAHAATAIENARRAQQARREAIDEERNRLARDLHDSVSQSLFSASLIAERLPAMARISTDEAWAGLELLQQLVRSALVEMRTLLIELRPAALAAAPLHQALALLAQAFAGRRGSPILTTLDVTPQLPQGVQVALYRIVQECLNNAIKHAQAATITIRMEVQPPATEGETDWDGMITLLISDDGRGFTPDDVGADQLGIGIMHERARAIGAQLQIGSAPGQGTRVALVWSGGAAREEQ